METCVKATPGTSSPPTAQGPGISKHLIYSNWKIVIGDKIVWVQLHPKCSNTCSKIKQCNQFIDYKRICMRNQITCLARSLLASFHVFIIFRWYLFCL
uniref:Uncharacterized protein n=1 Tax=Anguilla anguilla TaxID=7936 RepID=A0A0E9TA54_ANGAN